MSCLNIHHELVTSSSSNSYELVTSSSSDSYELVTSSSSNSYELVTSSSSDSERIAPTVPAPRADMQLSHPYSDSYDFIDRRLLYE